MTSGNKTTGVSWLEANYANLPNNEWVAVDQNGLVDHDPSFDDLLKKLEAKNIKEENVTFAFITHDIWQ